jgi:serine protease Do
MVTADNGDSTTLVDVLWLSNEYDIALLKVRDAKFLKDAGAADLACRTAQVGEDIRAEGNPFAVRFVSQWGKVGSKVQSIGHWRHAFSIGAPLAPGMSGGPVYDASGKVVGINVGISPIGGFYIAVPSSTACMLMGR